MSLHPSDSQILDGYRLIRFLGRGGFGEVWLCRSEAMGDYRALKWIPATNADRLEKEYESLLHFRNAAARLRSPHLVSIEHVNRNEAGLYYVMPLADGLTTQDPSDPAWQPLSLSAKIHAQTDQPQWFTSAEILSQILPVLQALQTLSDAGLVHRDVKPENILFFNGQPCLGDISLLGADASVITRRGTPGYATPSWYAGGHPDMYGAAATLYTLLTGNSPDKMARAAFLWPPQGEKFLTVSERAEWKRFHRIIRRATEEKVSERFVDFAAMAAHLRNELAEKTKLPRIFISALTVAGIAAATVMAAFRGKQAELHPPATESAAKADATPAASKPVQELTQEQRADYTALVGMIQGYTQDGKHANVLASVEELLSTYPQARTQPAYSIARAMALKGLGRIDEAKLELKRDIHLSPQITPMATRKDLWEEFGDLAEAENDLTRILKKFGPNSFPLFLRADVRAQRGDFSGVHADQQAALAIKPGDSAHVNLVETMWTPLETKYPAYADYLKSLPKSENSTSGTSHTAPDDSWVLNVFDEITSDITQPDIPLTGEALDARKLLVTRMRETMQAGDYGQCLNLLGRTTESVPALSDTPVLSLFRALLLQRLGRQAEAQKELDRPCHQKIDPRLVEARVCLMDALGKRRAAESLLNRMIGAVKPGDDALGEQSLPLLDLRANIRAALGDYSGVFSDQKTALVLIPDEPPARAGINLSIGRYARDRKRQWIRESWEKIQARFPGYAAFVKSQPGK